MHAFSFRTWIIVGGKGFQSHSSDSAYFRIGLLSAEFWIVMMCKWLFLRKYNHLHSHALHHSWRRSIGHFLSKPFCGNDLHVFFFFSLWTFLQVSWATSFMFVWRPVNWCTAWYAINYYGEDFCTWAPLAIWI